MDFTWRHVILLAKKMFHIGDEDVANRLGVSRSTIYRHRRKNDTSRFNPQIDVYEALFTPPNQKPETLKNYLDNLVETLNGDDFPANVRNLEIDNYKSYIKQLLRLAGKSVDNRADATPSLWDSGPVYLPDEFIESLVDYSVMEFIRLDPMDLLEEKYMLLSFSGKAPNGLGLIRNAIRFVKHIGSMKTMGQADNSIWDEHICEFIAVFTKILHEYIDFLRENSFYPDLNCSPFTIKPADIDKFERNATKYRTDLQFLYDQIRDIKGRGGDLLMFSNFPWGSKYSDV